MSDFTFLQLHEIAEADHRIIDPFSDEKLMLVGQVARVGPGTRILDLCCGKGELLCRWAQEYGAEGIGVDISEVFLAAARERAAEFGVGDRVHFEHGDAAVYPAQPASYDVVSCLGATWIGGGLVGTVELMLPALRPGGVLLLGEPYWTEPLPPDLDAGFPPEEFASLAGTAERLAAGGVEVVEMVLADGDSWDRYAAAQWWSLRRWLDDHPDDPRRGQVRDFLDRSRRTHLESQRRYLGWGVFVARPI